MKSEHAHETSSEPLRLARWIEALDRYGEQSALIAFDKDGAQRTSYAELDALSGRFATGLMEREIGRGDRLALLAPSSLEWIAAFLGIIRADVLLNADLVNDGDCLLLPLPLHHVYPLVVGLLTPLARGLSIVLPSSLTGPQMVRALNEGGVTIVIGVPRLLLQNTWLPGFRNAP